MKSGWAVTSLSYQPRSLVLAIRASLEHEAGFHYAASLCAFLTERAENGARRETTSVNNGNVSTQEETCLLIGGRYGEREGVAPRAVTQQVECEWVRGAAGAGYIFRPDRHRYSMLEIVVEQNRAAIRGPALRDSNACVRRHVRVLPIRGDRPALMAVGIHYVVDLAVVLCERCCGAEIWTRSARSNISPADKRQRIGRIESVGCRSGDPVVDVGIEAVIPAHR